MSSAPITIVVPLNKAARLKLSNFLDHIEKCIEDKSSNVTIFELTQFLRVNNANNEDYWEEFLSLFNNAVLPAKQEIIDAPAEITKERFNGWIDKIYRGSNLLQAPVINMIAKAAKNASLEQVNKLALYASWFLESYDSLNPIPVAGIPPSK